MRRSRPTATIASHSQTRSLSHELQAILGLALCDRSFCTQLLYKPLRAVAHFDLSENDRNAIKCLAGLRWDSLAEFAIALEHVAVPSPAESRTPKRMVAGVPGRVTRPVSGAPPLTF